MTQHLAVGTAVRTDTTSVIGMASAQIVLERRRGGRSGASW